MTGPRHWIVLILAIFTAAIPAISPAGNTGVIEVTTVLPGTQTPIPEAVITLRGPVSAGQSSQREATAGRNGRVGFRNPAPGQYFLNAQKDGFPIPPARLLIMFR